MTEFVAKVKDKHPQRGWTEDDECLLAYCDVHLVAHCTCASEDILATLQKSAERMTQMLDDSSVSRSSFVAALQRETDGLSRQLFQYVKDNSNEA